MTGRSICETLKGEASVVLERLKTLVHEGNIRRVIVKHEGRTVAEFPLTAGVIGALLAPVLAAVGTIVAMLKDCTIDVEMAEPGSDRESTRAAS
jgi:hypothetical protein